MMNKLILRRGEKLKCGIIISALLAHIMAGLEQWLVDKRLLSSVTKSEAVWSALLACDTEVARVRLFCARVIR